MTTRSFRRILELLEEHDVEYVVASTRRISLGDLTFRVLSIEALIRDKRALGRDKDLPVLRLLEAVVNRKRDE